MPKNSKVTLAPSKEAVTESVADLLALEQPMDYKSSQLSMGLSPGATAPGKGLLPSPDADGEDGRPSWNNKLEYILAGSALAFELALCISLLCNANVVFLKYPWPLS
jgi:solute carrier family 6 amino acid/orphan transporter-like 15/16/17/18/20